MSQATLPGIEVAAGAEPDQSHAAERLLFEQVLGDMPFADQYQALLAEGWKWRQAAYIAWQALPKGVRQPATLQEFATAIGLGSTRVIREWRAQNPAIDLKVAKLAAAVVWEGIPDVVEALIKSASNESYKHAPDRRVALEMAGLYVPKSKMTLDDDREAGDMDRKSDSELARLAGMAEGEGHE